MRRKEIIEAIENAEYELIAVKWKGTPVFVRVRNLSDLQIQAIGNISCIKTGDYPISNDWRAIANFADMQHLIVKSALVSPTYDECFAIIGKPDFAKEAETAFNEIQKDLLIMPKGPEKKQLETRCAALRMLFDFILPNDFTAQITEYVLGTKRTDIKLVTEEILFNCAVNQKRSGGRPSDYCTGNLSEFNKRDIDESAYRIYQQRVKEKKCQ